MAVANEGTDGHDEEDAEDGNHEDEEDDVHSRGCGSIREDGIRWAEEDAQDSMDGCFCYRLQWQ